MRHTGTARLSTPYYAFRSYTAATGMEKQIMKATKKGWNYPAHYVIFCVITV